MAFSIKDTQHNKSAIMLGVLMLCRNFLIVMVNIVMLNVVMPNVIMLNVIMLNVIMLNVGAPLDKTVKNIV